MDVEVFVQMLREQGVEQACKEIDLDFAVLANAETAEHYAGHQWIVQPNPAVGVVVNAVPASDLTDSVPWEEWFRVPDGLHHHVLYTAPQPQSQETWQGPPDDLHHPPAVLGRLWHVYNDHDATPALTQQSR